MAIDVFVWHRSVISGRHEFGCGIEGPGHENCLLYRDGRLDYPREYECLASPGRTLGEDHRLVRTREIVKGCALAFIQRGDDLHQPSLDALMNLVERMTLS